MSDHDEPSNPSPSDRLSFNDTSGAAARPPRELVLIKQGQRFVFRCEPSEEAALLSRLRTLAGDPQANLSWFDAAVLSHQVGEQLAQRLKQRRSTMK